MVMIVNEKHRYLIEEQFGSVIEFKRRVYYTCGFSEKVIKCFVEVMEVFVERFTQCIMEIWEKIKPVIYNFTDVLSEAWGILKDYADFKLVVDFPFLNTTFVKTYEKVPFGKYDIRKIKFKKIYHYRNNC